MIRTVLSALPALALATSLSAQSFPEAKSIVSVGGPITETIFALQEQDRLVARDTTSVFPKAANALPDVGYMRRLSAEGVLSVAPDLIIARSTSGPPETLDQLRSSSVPVVLIDDAFTAEAVVSSVQAVGQALGVPDKANALAATIQQDLNALAAAQENQDTPKRVMFVLSLDGGRLNVSGRGTGADGIITLAGATNVMAASFEGYKLVNAEAVITAAPDFIIMMDGRGDHSARKQEVLSLPSVALTPAGQTQGFFTIPGAALGFGPRTATFARDLHDRLYGAPKG